MRPVPTQSRPRWDVPHQFHKQFLAVRSSPEILHFSECIWYGGMIPYFTWSSEYCYSFVVPVVRTFQHSIIKFRPTTNYTVLLGVL